MSRVEVGTTFCRKRSRSDFELPGSCTFYIDMSECKLQCCSCSENKLDASPEASPSDLSLPVTSSQSDCSEDDDYVDQLCVADTIKSLEAELGIRTEDVASSCSRFDDSFGNGCTVLPSSDPDSIETDRLSCEDETGDSQVDSCSAYNESSPFSDGAILPEYGAYAYPLLEHGLLWDFLDGHVGFLEDVAFENLQAFTHYQEEETTCSWQSLTEAASPGAPLDENIWGL